MQSTLPSVLFQTALSPVLHRHAVLPYALPRLPKRPVLFLVLLFALLCSALRPVPRHVMLFALSRSWLFHALPFAFVPYLPALLRPTLASALPCSLSLLSVLPWPQPCIPAFRSALIPVLHPDLPPCRVLCPALPLALPCTLSFTLPCRRT